MKIVIDENIPFWEEAFSTIGEVLALPGREMMTATLCEATALIVRSVTPVNKELLAGTGIRFVGTATAGLDHIDQAYLTQHNIGFADAAGSNANSVAEYVLTALVIVASRFNISLKGKSLGIIGVGRIGSLVARKAQILGMTIILNDPPLARETGEACYRSIDEALQADFVTLHVPLIKEGQDKTVHLIDHKQLAKMARASVLINASRGEVVDNSALLSTIERGELQGTVLDVWEGEPSINWTLVQRATIATPHIAGYSIDAKIKGTRMIYKAACAFLGLSPTWEVPATFSKISSPVDILDAQNQDLSTLFMSLAIKLYDLQGDDSRMRALLDLPQSERLVGFDKLRKNYPTRREFHASTVWIQNGSPAIVLGLKDLGLSVHPIEK